MPFVSTSARMESFVGRFHRLGIDWNRSTIPDRPGDFRVAEASLFREGQVAQQASTGLVAAATTGLNTRGIFLNSKATAGVGVVVDEAIVLNGTTATNLTYANVSNVAVRASAGMASANLTGGGTDYTANTTNGTITRVGGGAIADGATVYVTYNYALTAAQIMRDGVDPRNHSMDWISGSSEGMVSLGVGRMILCTSEFDSSRRYELTGANARLYAGTSGQLTNDATLNGGSATNFLGVIRQLPNAEDQFMRCELNVVDDGAV